MSGHSKWSQIKHKKSLTDAQRSKEFAKLARQITVAAKEKGPDPAMNPALKTTMEKARAANMPSDNIERAVKRASGGDKQILEEVVFEAYGPDGAAIIIEGITDNKNRTAQEVKHLLSEHGAKLAAPGSARFLFQKDESGWRANSPMPVGKEGKEKMLKLLEALDSQDDINDIYTNADIES